MAKDFGAEGLGDMTGPPELTKGPKKVTPKTPAKPSAKTPPKPAAKMRTIPIDEGTVTLPKDEPYGLERPMKKGGKVKKYAKGGSVDGCAQRGKTKGRMV